MGSPESYIIDGTQLTILRSDQDTVGAFCLLDVVKQPGFGTLPHVHMLEWEAAYGLEGTLQIEAAGETVTMGPGGVWACPPGVGHRLSNVSDANAHYLLMCAPGGYDDFVREVGIPAQADPARPPPDRTELERLHAAAPRHGITVLPPEALLIRGAHTPLAAGRMSQGLPGFGDDVTVLAELGTCDDAPALLRMRLSPGQSVGLYRHLHRHPELLYVTAGRLDVFHGPLDLGTWEQVGPGRCVDACPRQPRAYRNSGDTDVEAFVVTSHANVLAARARRTEPAPPYGPRSIH